MLAHEGKEFGKERASESPNDLGITDDANFVALSGLIRVDPPAQSTVHKEFEVEQILSQETALVSVGL